MPDEITHAASWSGVVYPAFVIDGSAILSRRDTFVNKLANEGRAPAAVNAAIATTAAVRSGVGPRRLSAATGCHPPCARLHLGRRRNGQQLLERQAECKQTSIRVGGRVELNPHR